MSRATAHRLAHEITEAVSAAVSVGARLESVEPWVERRLIEADEGRGIYSEPCPSAGAES